MQGAEFGKLYPCIKKTGYHNCLEKRIKSKCKIIIQNIFNKMNLQINSMYKMLILKNNQDKRCQPKRNQFNTTTKIKNLK
jgi:hypothetical protein